MIPKKLHIIWVGDESRRPNKWIQTWIDHHPDWDVKIWGNDDLANEKWICEKQIRILEKEQVWEGVADIMRYEILYRYGGVYVDADSICLKPLDEQFLTPDFWAVYESEDHRKNLIANGYMGCVPDHRIMNQLIGSIKIRRHPLKKFVFRKFRFCTLRAWKMLGPALLTKTIADCETSKCKIFPSETFLPTHIEDLKAGCEKFDVKNYPRSYACHFWGQTFENY